jgi:phytoene synthase
LNQAAVSLAYRHCEQITRSRARNFYYGIRLLPPDKREAMCALYAMARRIDDIGDGAFATSPGPPDDGAPSPAAQLCSVRASLSLVAKAAAGGPAPPPGDPVVMALADAARRFPLPLAALEQLVEGCEWDLAGRRYETFDELLAYCRRVAGTIGRLSLAIYGSTAPERAETLADSLGVALQLTNILRDLVEDRDTYGRVYIPGEDLRRFGVGPDLDGPVERVIALVCYEAARATEWYERGLRLLPLLDWRSRACTAAMAGIYRRLLLRIEAAPANVLVKRVSLPPVEKATVAATALLRGAA